MLRSAVWLSLDKYGGQFLGLLFGVWVMTLTDAKVFGEFAVILAWFGLGNLLSESAFTITLIKYSEDDFNSSFITFGVIQILIAITYSVVLLILNTGLEYYLIVPVLLLQPLQLFYTSYLSRKEMWSFQGKVGIASNLISIVISLVLVLMNHVLIGLVTRLISRQLILSFIGGLLLFRNYEFLQLNVNFLRIRKQLKFSSSILIQGIVNSITELLFAQHMRLRTLQDLGLYNRSRQFSDFLFRTPTIIFERVAFLRTRSGGFLTFKSIWIRPIAILVVTSVLFLLFSEGFNVSFYVRKYYPEWGALGGLIWFIVFLGLISSMTTILNSWFNSCGRSWVNFLGSVFRLIILLIFMKILSWEHVVLLSSGIEMIYLLIVTAYIYGSSNSNNLV